MFHLIVIIPFALIWETVHGVALCPFPGRTSHAYFTNKSISSDYTSHFREGETVEYYCREWLDWWPVEDVEYSLTCQKDGTWTAPLPYCGILKNIMRTTSKVELEPCSDRRWGIFKIRLPRNTKGMYEVGLFFCSSPDSNLFRNSNLDQVKQCSRRKVKRQVFYECKQFDPRDIDYEVSFQMKKIIPVGKSYVFYNPGYQCRWPPVPVDADVVGQVVPGNTTEVSYKCKNNLVLDPRGPRTSTCDQLTGQWTEVPRCIRPDLHVQSSSDEQPGHFPQIPTVKDLGLPVPTNVKDVAGSAFPEIRGKNPFLSSKELDTLISNPLPGSRPIAQFMGEGPDPAIGDMANNFFENVNKRAVPVNAQVANRPSLLVISIIAIQLCAFIYFN